MQKIKVLTAALSLFALCLVIITPAHASPSNRHPNLKEKFPYGLLGDEYGLLLESDLAINACKFKPALFPPPKPLTSHYQYWQCFEKKNIALNCDSNGRADPPEGVMGLIQIKALKDKVVHNYIESRLCSIRECRSFLKDLAKIMKGQRYVCISGALIENEVDQAGHKTTSWLFDRLKTKRGCEGHDCDFTDEFKKDHCPG